MLSAIVQRPARLTAICFAAVALLGTVILSFARAAGEPSSFIDDLFTAVSAVCVTGLTVNDVATTYDRAGHWTILLLMQVGGTGIMVVTSALLLLGGRRLGLRSEAALAEAVEAPSATALRRTLTSVLLMTAVCEVVGAAALYPQFSAKPGIDDPAFTALFHAVSAFCNAGFSTLPQGLTPYASSVSLLLTFAALITLGGLGFPVLDEVFKRWRSQIKGHRPERLSLHARVALTVSMALTLFGAVAFYLLFFSSSDSALTPMQRATVSLFQSVTARTAGFSAVDTAALPPAALMLLSTLMLVGASPGSTGGGIKTTTFAVVITTFRSELSGMIQPELFGRRLSTVAVRRALAVFFASSAVVLILSFVLLATQSSAPEHLVFEAVSAFATVGLSAGVTDELSSAGKVAVIVTMLIGRLGPITFALAIAQGGEAPRRQLPEEGVLIG